MKSKLATAPAAIHAGLRGNEPAGSSSAGRGRRSMLGRESIPALPPKVDASADAKT
ncbi:MAG: hypothetical protein WAN23_09275 [Candidatus Acidiferrales bacterium]